LRYQFDWDPEKEKQNIRKHRVSFRRAAMIFHDPNQLSLFDDAHSDDEDRWITIGIDANSILRTVVHTYKQLDEKRYVIRIISARKATLSESKQYKEGLSI
jgi:uncharacterized protein